MKKAEYEKTKEYTYLEYCDYLQQKYGIGRSDFMTKSWNKNKKVTQQMRGWLPIISTRIMQLCYQIRNMQ